MSYCCVPFCKTDRKSVDFKEKKVSLHEILHYAKNWIKAISRDKFTLNPVIKKLWVPKDKSVVCSLHFEEKCFKKNLKIRKLLPDSVPSIFTDYPKYKQNPPFVSKSSSSRKRKIDELCILLFCPISVLSLAALISSVEGQCKNDVARYGFFLCVVVISMLEAIALIIAFILRQDKKIKTINLPLTLLMNDAIILIFYFINCTLSMLSIGRCHYKTEARVLATLFAIALFLVYVGLIYTDYKWYQSDISVKEKSTNGSTTVTETSPTVLT